MKQESEKPNSVLEDEHVVKMWEPLDFDLDSQFDYLNAGRLKTFRNWLWRRTARLVLVPLNKIALGFSIEGMENRDLLFGSGAVTVSNHVHYMDCTMIDQALCESRTYYVTLEDNFKIPVVRHLMRVLGGVPLSKNPHRMMELFNSMQKALDNGSLVQIYPEGVLKPYCRQLRRFRDGAFVLAYKSNKPVLPMAFVIGEPKGIFALYKRKPCFKLALLKPVYPDLTLPKKEAVEKLKTECENAIRTRINEG